MQIKESAENYLERILMLKNQNGTVRSIDIAHAMNFTKASVSVAMKNFRQEGYIKMEDDGEIVLTEKGLKVAERIYERHQVIARALMALGVEEKTAYEDSCKIEHDISDESFLKLKEHVLRHEEKE
ncbi:metal-dependent transcriptional regulator [Ructibacterium gallinarum]|uniref:Metal-dependent transcriptional regulator n=1 Tax=Ructibacterium gallinarum TaxID=2779355 RepID=A0A9D5R8X6_9FIRM|nr:metal-dependent transcriptional regulator [Ructibacterium gallinarum]MBE5039879.1 metal-dependent transcriptional regulator [Ructibacterium gallinarum]